MKRLVLFALLIVALAGNAQVSVQEYPIPKGPKIEIARVVSPGFSVTGVSMQARRSRPAEPGVAYWGSCSRSLRSRMRTSSLRIFNGFETWLLRGLRGEHFCDVINNDACNFDFRALGDRVFTALVDQCNLIVVCTYRGRC